MIAEAQATLQANPPPESVGVEPTLSEVTGARYAKLTEKTPEHIAEPIAANNTTIATLNGEVAALDAQIREKREALSVHAESKAAWAAYEKALEQHPAQCETAKSVWNAWNKLAHRIADLQSNRQNETASKFLGVVSSLASSVLGGRPLTFSEDGEILLDGLSIELLSDSTQWRVAACVRAAIALHANSPLLILDGADILDDCNRTSLLHFILSEIAPKFQHTILLATVRGNLADEKPFPGAATKYIMNEGQLFKCMAGGQTWIAQ